MTSIHKSSTFELIFHGEPHSVSVKMPSNKTLMISVYDKTSLESWSNEFSASQIEEISHKTGNFKQFIIFVNMLYSALSQSSDSLTLDLLTYSDLLSLRERKRGSPSRQTTAHSKLSPLSTKRYLIMTYTVEFDRIHYPLTLNYDGSPDPRELHEEIRRLNTLLATKVLYAFSDLPDQHHTDELKKKIKRLSDENRELRDNINHLQENISRHSASRNESQQVHMLRQMVQNMEEELIHERNEHHKALSKLSSENKRLTFELDELQASERSLKVRVKNLMNELSSVKRRSLRPSASSATDFTVKLGKKSTNSGGVHSGNRLSRSSTKLPPIGSVKREPTYHFRQTHRHRSRSNSRDSHHSNSNRSRSFLPDRSQEGRTSDIRSKQTKRSSFRSRTPSPATRSFSSKPRPRTNSGGSNQKRFDPTGYVKEQQRKRKESSERLKRGQRAERSLRDKSTPSSAQLRVRSRRIPLAQINDDLSGYNKTHRRSRTPSVSSIASVDPEDYSLDRRHNTELFRHYASPHTFAAETSNMDDNGISSYQSPLGYSRNYDDVKTSYKLIEGSSPLFDRSHELQNIDRRLERLRTFMREHIPS